MKRIAVVIIGISLVGCSSKNNFEYNALDLLPTQEELVEFSLGHYLVPIPGIEKYGNNRVVLKNRLEFEFNLYALVSPKQKKQLDEAWLRHEGTVRDQIIQICRNASVEDLNETELISLKAHMIDAIQSLLGSKSIRRLLITEAMIQEL